MPQERLTPNEFEKRFGSLDSLKPPPSVEVPALKEGGESYSPEEFMAKFPEAVIAPVKELAVEPPATDEELSRLESAWGSYAQSFAGAFAGIPESVGIASRMIGDYINWYGINVPGTDKKGWEVAYQFGQDIRKAARDMFPTDPRYQDEFITTTLAGGAGSLTAFFAGGIAGKGLKLSAGLVTVVLGATAVSADEFNRAYAETGDLNKAYTAWVANLPIGATEAVPVLKALKRIDKATGGMLTKNLIGKAIGGGLEEMIQETVQNFLTNATARQVYDAERELMEGVVEGGAAGFILGMAANAIGLSVKRRLDKRRDPLTLEQKVRAQIEAYSGEESDAKFNADVAIAVMAGMSEYSGMTMEEVLEGVGKGMPEGGEVLFQEFDAGDFGHIKSTEDAIRYGLQLSDKAAEDLKAYAIDEYARVETAELSPQELINQLAPLQLMREALSAKDDKYYLFDRTKGEFTEAPMSDIFRDSIDKVKSGEGLVTAPIFYSKLREVLGEIKQEKFQSQQLLQQLRKAGVKEGELEMSGVLQYLTDNEKVTKEEILGAIEEIKFEDFVYSGEKIDEMPVVRTDLERLGEIADDQLRGHPLTPVVQQEYQSLRQDYGFMEATPAEVIDQTTDYLARMDEARRAPIFGQYVLEGEHEGYVELFVTAPMPSVVGETLEVGTWEELPSGVSFLTTNHPDVTILDERGAEPRYQIRYKEKLLGGANTIEEALKTGADLVNAGTRWEDGHEPYKDVVNPIVRARMSIMREAETNDRVLFLHEGQTVTKTYFGVMPKHFQQNWKEILMRRVVRYAAERGIRKIAWTTGEQQAVIYPGLTQFVDEIRWNYIPVESGTPTREQFRPDLAANILVSGWRGEVQVFKGSFEVLTDGSDPKGSFTLNQTEQEATLEETVGEENVKKILEHKGIGTLKGQDLEVGGAKLKDLYDNVLPAVVNKLFGKKALGGGRVEKEGTEVRTKEIGPTLHASWTGEGRRLYLSEIRARYSEHISDDPNIDILTKANALKVRDIMLTRGLSFGVALDVTITEGFIENEEQAQAVLDAFRVDKSYVIEKLKVEGAKVHSFEIPPALHLAAMFKGFPLYQQKKGAITFAEDGRAFIYLMQESDVTTIIHELGHLGRKHLKPEDQTTANNFVGAKDNNWTVDQEEKFATGFEKWVSEGRTSNPRLKKVFQSLRTWFLSIYKGITGSSIDVEVSEEMKQLYDRMVGGTDLMNEEQLLEWAKGQVDEGQWVNWVITGEGDAPGDLSKNSGHDMSVALYDGDPEPEGKHGIRYKAPKGLWNITRKLFFPEFMIERKTRKEYLPDRLALESTVDILEGDLALRHQEKDFEQWYRKIFQGTSKEERKMARELVDDAYKAKKELAEIEQAKEGEPSMIHADFIMKLEKTYEKHPKLKNVIEGVDEKGGLIELLEYEKQRYRTSKRLEFRESLDPLAFEAFTSVIDDGLSVEAAIDLQHEAYAELAKREKIAAWLKNKPELSVIDLAKKWDDQIRVRTRKLDSVRKREVKRLNKNISEYRSIDKWGLKDFMTNIELGNYRIVDEKGATKGFARSLKDARRKMKKVRDELRAETGEKVPLWIAKPEISRINPTEKRRDILTGEEDILEVLPRYIHAMEKRIVMNPIIEKYHRRRDGNPESFPADVQSVIQRQINSVMGSKYSWIEDVVDDFLKHGGHETGAYRKIAGRVRSLQANLKLGYRVTAAAVNLGGGFGMTYTKVGAEFFYKGRKILKEGKYTGPDGIEMDMAKVIKEIEDVSGLGIDFAVEASGEISLRTKIWKPLGMFQWPEKPIRRHGFMANYVLQREKYGLSHNDAVWQAKENMRFQQATYNIAAVPEVLRSPSGKVIGQFKTFLINQIQFISTLKGTEWLRYAEVQLLLAGPRGFIYLLRSLPFIGLFGLLDDAEKVLLGSDDFIARLGRGVAGMVGADVTAPATYQMPHRVEDWLGPTLSDMIRLFRDAVIPTVQAAWPHITGREEEAPAYLFKRFEDWALGLAPIMYYLDQFMQSVQYWESWGDVKRGNFKKAFHTQAENLQMPNVWVRDSQGGKSYVIGSWWDRALLLMGASPIEKSKVSAFEDMWRRNMRIQDDNTRLWYDRVVGYLNKNMKVPEELFDDARLYQIDPRSIPNRFRWAQMTVEQRQVLRSKILRRARAISHFGLDEK